MFRRISVRSVSLPLACNTAREYCRTLSALRSASDPGTLRPVSLTSRIEAMASPAREAVRECYGLFAEALVIPNEWLPRRLQRKANMRLVSESGRTNDWHKEYGVTPASIFRERNSRMKAKEEETDCQRIQAEMESRARVYGKQVTYNPRTQVTTFDNGNGIEFDTDGQEALIAYAERSFGRMIKRMESFDGSSLTDAEFLKKLRE